ncbi:MAG: hypothetical protein IH838_13270 [Proteobacteria bacterium]|nr:hypothetical protein [Pseudomonadota bacterium]
MPNFMTSFFSEASARGARSTALHALQWVIGMLLVSLPMLAASRAPSWLLISVAAALGGILVTFVTAYVYFLFTNPDALRSESFTLSKMAIERGLVGDSLSGLRDATLLEQPKNEPKALTAGEEKSP